MAHVVSVSVPKPSGGSMKLRVKLKGSRKSLTPKEKAAVINMFDRQRVTASSDCDVILFGKKPVAVQRCHNRKTFKNPNSGFNKAARKRAKAACRTKKQLFKKC